jgi:hypothetical protein
LFEEIFVNEFLNFFGKAATRGDGGYGSLSWQNLAEVYVRIIRTKRGGEGGCDESFDENDKESHVVNNVDEEDLKNEDDLKGEGLEMMDDEGSGEEERGEVFGKKS